MPHAFELLDTGDTDPDITVGPLDATPLTRTVRFGAVREAASTRAYDGMTAQPTRDEVLARPSETEESPV
ncbi:hypothetical protein ACFC00_40635 [Streptomyces adustus]|uniref:hypothetical protein n=1 Tax=Streptomyces adustus TaxID=1609272 RepID=UPI0035E102AE